MVFGLCVCCGVTQSNHFIFLLFLLLFFVLGDNVHAFFPKTCVVFILQVRRELVCSQVLHSWSKTRKGGKEEETTRSFCSNILNDSLFTIKSDFVSTQGTRVLSKLGKGAFELVLLLLMQNSVIKEEQKGGMFGVWHDLTWIN